MSARLFVQTEGWVLQIHGMTAQFHLFVFQDHADTSPTEGTQSLISVVGGIVDLAETTIFWRRMLYMYVTHDLV